MDKNERIAAIERAYRAETEALKEKLEHSGQMDDKEILRIYRKLALLNPDNQEYPKKIEELERKVNESPNDEAK